MRRSVETTIGLATPFIAFMEYEILNLTEVFSRTCLVSLFSLAVGLASLFFIPIRLINYGPRQEIPRTMLLLFIAGTIALVIVSFGGLYEYCGVRGGFTSRLSGSAYLYFSAITFTTTGYGDIVPIHLARLVAACEAITGYVALGLAISSIPSIFRRPPAPSEPMSSERRLEQLEARLHLIEKSASTARPGISGR